MKVCIVSNFYPPVLRGGAEQVAALSATAFREAGYEVIILTAAPWRGRRSLLPRATMSDGARVYRWYPLNLYFFANASRYPAWLRVVWTFLDTWNVHSWLAARWVLSRERPDLIVSHNLKGLGYTLPRLFARAAPRYCHVLHDMQLAHPSGLLFPESVVAILRSPATRGYQAMTRWLFQTTSQVVSPSKFLLDFYRRLNFFAAAKTVVVRNPVAGLSARAPHEGVNVTFVGQLEPHKGLEVLLKAWSIGNFPGATLHLAGDGSLARAAAAGAAKDQRIHCHGWLQGQALAAVWSVTDVLVCPSIWLENAPLVVIEALARGIFVVASDVGGIPELAALSPDGVRLVPHGDAPALAAALEGAIAAVRRGERVTPVRMPSPADYASALWQLTNP